MNIIFLKLFVSVYLLIETTTKAQTNKTISPSESTSSRPCLDCTCDSCVCLSKCYCTGCYCNPCNSSITTASPSVSTSNISPTSTTTLFPTIVVYGCARFTVAGDIFFNITDYNAEKCVSKCLSLNDKFRFFITSFFLT